MHYTSREVYEYISKTNNDPIMEWRTCRITGTPFPIYQSDHEFYEKVSPIVWWKKYLIPRPTLCPEERERRRMSRRNERNLYHNSCEVTWDKIISNHATHRTHKIVHPDVWKSDTFDPLVYWKDVDFSKSIMEQIHNVQKNVPALSLSVEWNENADYINNSWRNKNCYLIFYSDYNKDCCYTDYTFHSENCIDCYYVQYWQQCYNCIGCSRIHTCFSCQDSCDCSSSYYLSSCKNCKNCIGCVWLTNKEYCIFNKQKTKEQFETFLNTYKQLIHTEKFKEKVDWFFQTFPRRWSNIQTSEKCFWDNIEFSKKIHFWHNCEHSNSSAYLSDCQYCSDSYDITGWGWEELWWKLLYEWETVWSGAYKCCFNSDVYDQCENMLYSRYCMWSKNCFWCVSLRFKEYCIFNKQYTQDGYEKMIPKIINHMTKEWSRWEFFPTELSPYPYNKSLAHEIYPLQKEDALARWYTRDEKESKINIPVAMQTITANDLPKIQNASNEILKKVIICTTTWKPFRITQMELEFCRKHSIPLATHHPTQRHVHRLEKRPPRSLHLRTCDKTGEEILSVYPQDVPFKVYSQEAYQQEMFG